MPSEARRVLPRMGGRDPHQPHRSATPLELFFDLTFVIAFSVASSQFAHAIAEEHVLPGLLGFSFSMFAVIWAWINFTWLASAYDTDDWIFRVVTMVQMVGVLILAMGLEPMFHSLVEGDHVENRVIVLGYVVMRVALIFQWLRVARQDPARRHVALQYAGYLAIVQLGWVAVLFIDADVPTTFLMISPLFILEMATPRIAERKTRTPWHAHHIAERYGLMAIIALGECLIGAIETLRAIVALHGWSMDAALVGLGGTGLAFALWWVYFTLPNGQALHIRRHKSFIFGYGHMFIFAAIAAAGAGLHVLAYYIDHEAHISAAGAVATVAIPVTIFKIALTWLYGSMAGYDPLNLGLTALVVGSSALAIALAAAGVPVTACLLVIVAGPAIMIVVDEIAGRPRRTKALARLEEQHAK
ncbi:low temperature requirement protein A [Pseudarthrobacter sp. J75]|uniref:low temperature requirement protein A n=1 Tax=unclassified Pseudarthrobacter TaxID=2647000 RepID=UPI002E816A6F|nr:MULTISPECIES: low temperature requirement protein A [unclassified Pseudarthrobacter]MEE2523710.1 low temperature requirement protein A [Pseudarthrobacter sp. J47]MEE2530101.1 low temperature requirement protein A [Pseudarthrobacter sp. J75]MEE2570387.1 low temperature requirement protein A [Pseudarthrobacter sp. J64]